MATAPQERVRRLLKRELSKLDEESNENFNKTTLNLEQIANLEQVAGAIQTEIESLRNLHQEILTNLEDDDEFDSLLIEFQEERKSFGIKLRKIKAKCETQRSRLNGEQTRQSLIPTGTPPGLNSTLYVQNPIKPKLAEISVPEFDGEILNFPNFRGLFENLIHNRTELSNVQKLHYLKQSLVGSAKNLIRDFTLDEDSYPQAWDYLLNRFDNKRIIARTLFKRLIAMETIKNASQLRDLVDNVDVIIHGLEANGFPVTGTFSKFVCYFVSTKLDYRTYNDWENSITTSNDLPIHKTLQMFLRNRVFLADEHQTEAKASKNKSNKSETNRNESKTQSKTAATTTVTPSNANSKSVHIPPNIKCVVCTNNHYLNNCSAFLSKSINDRFQVVKENRLCRKCFSPFHVATECKRLNCKTCNESHHTLLHFTRAESTQSTSTDSSNESKNDNKTQTKTTLTTIFRNHKQVYLSTAVVYACSNVKTTPIRILLDNGSQATLIRKSLINKLKLKTIKQPIPTELGGMTSGKCLLEYSVQLTLKSRINTFSIILNAEIVNEIPYNVPKLPNEHLTGAGINFELAECDILDHNEIDLLVGAEYAELLCGDKRIFLGSLILRESKFGYVLSGSNDCQPTVSKPAFSGLTKYVDFQLQKFWELDECSVPEKLKSSEHDEAENLFNSLYYRDANGRFVVPLLIKPSIDILNGSFFKAKQLLLKNERRRDAVIRREYINFMHEYIQLGHMRQLNNFEINQSDAYYIPHHIVKKLSSTTTKYRVVFNASMIDNSNTSLNNHLYTGPVLQPDLFDTIIGFRFHNIAFCADIEKMYKQILIKPDECKYQRILWRNDDNETLRNYELKTITYGTTSASYLATKCLQILGNDIAMSDPVAATVICSHFYMDDLMTGAETISEAIKLQQSVHSQLLSAGMKLRKYQSNSNEFLDQIDPELVEASQSRILGSEFCVNVLGLIWSPKFDNFRVILNLKPLPEVITKRVLLSDISSIFDVVGILAPVTITAKLFIQDLWRAGISWDEPVSDELCEKFLKYRNNLADLRDFVIPRRVINFVGKQCKQLIGFCDASEKAYCAVIYVRSVNENGDVTCNFLCAKSRLAPLKALTIPKLELQGALILSQLLKRNSINLKITEMYAFTDASIVLSWFKHDQSRLKIFVSNRVEQIKRNIGLTNWFHVRSNDNPADLATRGIDSVKFKNCKRWLNGPEWLVNDFDNHLIADPNNVEIIPELRKISILFVKVDISILKRYSSINRLINIIAWMLRFIDCSRGFREKIPNLSLTVCDRNKAFNVIYRLSQNNSFPEDFNRLKQNINLKKGSPLLNLNGFLDENNVIRVGGRLAKSRLPFDRKHPIILSVKCKLVELIVIDIHTKYFHCNLSVIKTKIIESYWIIGNLTNLIKKVIRNCILCTRLRAVTGKQIMGQLPSSRTEISRPFYSTGIDLTGHVNVKCLAHRTAKINKAYLVFFVCFSTRAIHIELVSNLSTESFLDCLRRFVSRRGKPYQIFTDNGKNFVGAYNQLNPKTLSNWSTSEGIKWNFITPYAPHQGGIWEAAVKSGKSLLLRATQGQVFNFEELYTIVCQAEAILNSRPICYRRNLSHDDEVITPGHFLIGEHLLAVPNINGVEQTNLKKRLNLIQSTVESYWNVWRKTYLNQLQYRSKWSYTQPNVKIGDLVLLKEENVPVLKWPMGRIICTFPDIEGIVRNVEVKTQFGQFRRSVQKLVQLPNMEDF